MRIKSPFKDYYDGLQGLDLEREPFYFRKTREADSDHYWQRDHNVSGYTLYRWLIGFCGKLYPFLEFTPPQKDGAPKSSANYFFHFHELEKWARTTLKKRELEVFEKQTKAHELWFQNGHTGNCFDTFFDRFDTPIWLVGKNPGFQAWNERKEKVIVSPRLAAFNFARIVPPYQAWMELTRFLSNKAAPPKPIPPISNEDMRDIKGFDKWSFRKPKAT